jgi:hypothetical protein
MLFTSSNKENIEENKKNRINSFIQCGDVPENGPQLHYIKYRNQTNKWLGFDSLGLFQENGGHPAYDENSIDYTLNSKGYRCPAFNQTASIKILSLGCSYVFGVGLKQSELYHEIVAQNLRDILGCSVINWNLGSGGASNDFITRVLYESLPILKPDLIIINFTVPGRREYLAANGDWVKFAPGNKVNWSEGVTREFHVFQRKMASHYQDALHFSNLFRGIEAKLSNENHVFTTVNREFYEVIQPIFGDKFVTNFDILDTSRDHLHPGANSHKAVAKKCLEYMRKTHILDKLKQKADHYKNSALSILE